MSGKKRSRPMLMDNQVHLWTIPLDLAENSIEQYGQYLSSEESERARRFYFERHRRRYIASHGALRVILSDYLDADPIEIQFDQRQYRKPKLSAPFSGSRVHFNLSHSHELAVLGVVLDHEIGVDVEYILTKRDMDAIAARFFSPSEHAAYLGLPEDQRSQGFTNCWTRKEAFIKALGEGLSYPLDNFEVTLKPGEPVRMVRIGDDFHEAPRWTLESFQPAPDYVAAIALRARGVQIRYFSFGE